MITIAGRSFDISTITDKYPPAGVEGQLLSTMSQSSENYKYDTLSQLEFELRLRKEIVNAARELDRSRFSFATFHKSECNPEYWDRTENGGFKLKSGASPSEAINDIFINGEKYATECATAMNIVYYKALLNVFGNELFDKQFPQIYLMNWLTIDPLLISIGIPITVKDYLLGDRTYFDNPDVDPKTPEWQGENVIVLPDGLYYGHGIGILPAEAMIRALNAHRKEDATKPAYLLDEVAHPNFKKLADIYNRNAVRPAPVVWRAFPAAISRA
jgi:protein-glutamine gamma-glutamyltransferase